MQSGYIRSALELDPLQRTVESVSCPVSMPSVRLQAGSEGIGLAPGRNPFFQLNGAMCTSSEVENGRAAQTKGLPFTCSLHATTLLNHFCILLQFNWNEL